MSDDFIPEHIATIVKCRTHSKESLDEANQWLIDEAERGGPDDLNKFERGVWLERMKMVERRVQQGYKSLGIDDEAGNKGIRVFPGERPPGGRANRHRQFNDGGDEEYGEPQTLGDLVIQSCGEDSDEWQQFLRLKGLFGAPKPVELSVVSDDAE